MVTTKLISSALLIARVAFAGPPVQQDECDPNGVATVTETVYVHTTLGDLAVLPVQTGGLSGSRPGSSSSEGSSGKLQGGSSKGPGIIKDGSAKGGSGGNSAPISDTISGDGSNGNVHDKPGDDVNIDPDQGSESPGDVSPGEESDDSLGDDVGNDVTTVPGIEDPVETSVTDPDTNPTTSNAPQDPTSGGLVPTSSPIPDGGQLPDNSTGVTPNSTSPDDLTDPVVPSDGSYKSVLYFTNWGIYGAEHYPSDFPADKVTHLLYSFADIEEDGEVVGSDSWADVEMRYQNDSWNDSDNNAYGCVKQLFLQKKRNRQLKVLLSIGGWSWSPKFAPVAATAEGRRRFASSAVALMGDWGFDGLDIDWEYPSDDGEAADFVALLEEVRAELDAYAEEHATTMKRAEPYRFQLTVAVPAGDEHYKKLRMSEMEPLLDGWHLMAYDYTGPWASLSGHQANVYPGRGTGNGSDESSTPADTDSALSYYVDAGVDPRKIMLGLPLYGRSFADTEGPGQPFSGPGGGSSEQGVWRYSDLPRPDAEQYWDGDIIASWSYDEDLKEFVSYDNVRAAEAKAEYLIEQGLGGVIFWESSSDKTGDESLVGTMARELGTLDSEENLLDYPGSRYDNIRDGLSGEE